MFFVTLLPFRQSEWSNAPSIHPSIPPIPLHPLCHNKNHDYDSIAKETTKDTRFKCHSGQASKQKSGFISLCSSESFCAYWSETVCMFCKRVYALLSACRFCSFDFCFYLLLFVGVCGYVRACVRACESNFKLACVCRFLDANYVFLVETVCFIHLYFLIIFLSPSLCLVFELVQLPKIVITICISFSFHIDLIDLFTQFYSHLVIFFCLTTGKL